MRQLMKYCHQHLVVFWVLLTTLVGCGIYYFSWQHTIDSHYKILAANAQFVARNLDNLVEDLLQEIYTLPVFNTHLSDCQTKVLPILDHISNNSPRISGLIITDSNNNLICSNLPDNRPYLSRSNELRSITGPYKTNGFEQPVYKISQKTGNYYVGVIVLASLMAHELLPKDSTPDAVALYSQPQKTSLLKVELNSARTRRTSNTDDSSIDNSPVDNYMSAKEKLESVHGLDINVSEKNTRVIYQLWINHLLSLGILIIVSYLLYLLVQKNFNNYYSLHNAMKQAMKHKRFYPVYQPIYDSINQTYSGIEVLLRWSDFNDEIIMPDHFIVEAEKTGVIVPITLQIIETTFIETRKLLESKPFFYVSFNVSALHFTDKDFFDKFYALVAQYSISPQQIIIEITERDFIDKNNHIFITQMQKLIKEGFSLAIDDYGTGHASISYIQNFPFNYLKIDRIFVQAIGTKAINESLIDTIISMAKNLNLKIIAEGVETSEQVNYLIHNKVPYLQGWYFSKALTIEALMDLLEGKNDEDLL